MSCSLVSPCALFYYVGYQPIRFGFSPVKQDLIHKLSIINDFVRLKRCKVVILEGDLGKVSLYQLIS